MDIKQLTYSALKATKILPFVNAISVLKILEIDFGHLLSSYHLKPIDRHNNAIPWFTYPAIEYLNGMDLSKKTIFEYGSGNSTIYWARNAKSVISIENNAGWYYSIKKSVSKAKYILETDKTKYINSIKGNKRKYDIIIVDGDFRDSCVKTSFEYLKDDGVMILDNSDWFQKTCAFLRDKGLIEVNFSGFAPSNHYTSTTSFFMKRKFKYLRKNINKLSHIGSISPTVSNN